MLFTQGTGYPDYFGPKPANYKELEKYNQHYADIAASIQVVAEESILSLAREAHRKTGSKNLCLAGGVALNSVANGRILKETPIEQLYVQPAAGDGGCALGAALYTWHAALGNSESRFIMDHAYWGEEYDSESIKSHLDKHGVDYKYFDNKDDLNEVLVDKLVDGQVIGRFDGRFEWGPRALGNRSIIADPRNELMKDIVNTKIKFREPFRPFAPSVTVESCEDFFQLNDSHDSYPARFMLLVTDVKDEKQNVIPAVSQLGTARVQTVHRETNPSYYDLISKFGNATGVPILLNTSFNVRGEPIVNTPADALNTYNNSGIDSLVLGQFMINKS